MFSHSVSSVKDQCVKPESVTTFCGLELMSVIAPLPSSPEPQLEAGDASCLNRVFELLIEEQHPLSLVRWETGNAATR